MEVPLLQTNDPYRADWAEARMRARKTQRQLAREIGVSYSAYQKYEYGRRNPRPPTLERLLRALDLPGQASANRS